MIRLAPLLVCVLVACSKSDSATPPPPDPPESPSTEVASEPGALSVESIVARIPREFRAEIKGTRSDMTSVKVWDGDAATLWMIVNHGDDGFALAAAKASLKPNVQELATIDWAAPGTTKFWARFRTYVMNGSITKGKVAGLRAALKADDFLPPDQVKDTTAARRD